MAMEPKRKRVSQVYQFFKQGDASFVKSKMTVGRLVEERLQLIHDK